MKAAIVYPYSVYYGDAINMASRFLASYNAAPPGEPHISVVCCNGCRADDTVQSLFSLLPDLYLLEHDNSGWDIGAFQFAAQVIPCDLMLFFGASAWFPRAGWMSRVIAASRARGIGLFGAHGNAGDPRVGVSPHLRTTGFWLPPELLNRYPMRVTHPGLRYQFEHGPNCLTSWVNQQGYGVWVVGHGGEYPLPQCDFIPNGFHRGDQSDLLFRDRLTDSPYF